MPRRKTKDIYTHPVINEEMVKIVAKKLGLLKLLGGRDAKS